MTDYWFTPKRYGYGATPANWKGLVATLAFIGLVLVLPRVIVASQQNPRSPIDGWAIGVCALIVVALAAGFIVLARAKTDGEWGWRWGK